MQVSGIKLRCGRAGEHSCSHSSGSFKDRIRPNTSIHAAKSEINYRSTIQLWFGLNCKNWKFSSELSLLFNKKTRSWNTDLSWSPSVYLWKSLWWYQTEGFKMRWAPQQFTVWQSKQNRDEPQRALIGWRSDCSRPISESQCLDPTHQDVCLSSSTNKRDDKNRTQSNTRQRPDVASHASLMWDDLKWCKVKGDEVKQHKTVMWGQHAVRRHDAVWGETGVMRHQVIRSATRWREATWSDLMQCEVTQRSEATRWDDVKEGTKGNMR